MISKLPDSGDSDHMVDAFRYAMQAHEHVETRWEKFLRICRRYLRKFRSLFWEWVPEAGKIKPWMGCASFGWHRKGSDVLMVIMPFHWIVSGWKHFYEWALLGYPYNCEHCMKMNQKYMILLKSAGVREAKMRNQIEAIERRARLHAYEEPECKCPSCTSHNL